MPKAPPAGSGPLNCLFAINKPTGRPSMTLLNQLQPLLASSALFAKVPTPPHSNDRTKQRKWKAERIKIGQGGTLDPLADGVLGPSLPFFFVSGGDPVLCGDRTAEVVFCVIPQSSERTRPQSRSPLSSTAPRSA